MATVTKPRATLGERIKARKEFKRRNHRKQEEPREHLARDERGPDLPRPTNFGKCADCGEPIEQPRMQAGKATCARCDSELLAGGQPPLMLEQVRLPKIEGVTEGCLLVGALSPTCWAWGYRLLGNSPQFGGLNEPCRVLDDSDCREVAIMRAARALAMRAHANFLPRSIWEVLDRFAGRCATELDEAIGNAVKPSKNSKRTREEATGNGQPPGPSPESPAPNPSAKGGWQNDSWYAKSTLELRTPEAWGLTIDPEFKARCRQLDDVELEKLRSDIMVRGCLDPLVVWECRGEITGLEIHGPGCKGVPHTIDTHPPKRILIDGHHRYQLCYDHRKPVAIVTLDFPDRAAVLKWIDAHQVGRRNLSPAERDVILARDYRAEVDRRREEKKTAPKKDGAKQPAPQNGAHVEPRKERPKAEKAAHVVAEKHRVSPATVKRAAKADREKAAVAGAAGGAAEQLDPLSRSEIAALAALPADKVRSAAKQGRAAIDRLIEETRAQADASRPNNQRSATHCEPRGTVRVPFKKEHRCKASFTLFERADGRWFYVENWTNAGGGGVHGGLETAAYNYPNGVKGAPRKGYADRQSCLQAAAERLEESADAQGKRYWPAAARKVLREWRESLTPAPEPRRGTGTQLRKRVVADRDAAVRVIEAHLAEYGARAEYEQSEHLLDAINAWRGQRKVFGSAATSAARKRKKPK